MLLALCGIPGSGKSTLARSIANVYNAILYSYDDMPNANLLSKRDEVHRNMWISALRDLKEDKIVVLDDLHTTIEMRKNMLDVLSEAKCKKIIIVMQTPFEICVQRNSARSRKIPTQLLYNFHKRYIPPTLEEGFDEIIYYP